MINIPEHTPVLWFDALRLLTTGSERRTTLSKRRTRVRSASKGPRGSKKRTPRVCPWMNYGSLRPKVENQNKLGTMGMGIQFLFLFLFLLFPACCSRAEHIPKKVCFSDRCFDVEIVQTFAERAKGLQFRKSLEKNAGMLFIFSESRRHNFWMKDTFISLDIIWINRNKQIVSIVPNILPCTTPQCPVYTPDKNALYVLEVNAGVTTELGLKVGDQAVFLFD